MSRQQDFHPPSLSQHFEAPDGYVGRFAWICGYSADANFLNDALERFTRQTLSQRAYSGRIAAAVMLDAGNPPITLLDVPGMLHLPIKFVNRPFRLLHAKVALLGFRHTGSDGWLLRLIVSTGNWTRQTLEESLDLAWRADVSSQDLAGAGEHVRMRCADIKAASSMFSWLQELHDDRPLHSFLGVGEETETASAILQVSAWVMLVAKEARGKPRFFDNQKRSLLKQLPSMVRAHAPAVSRNYICMGSGFFEATSDCNRIPYVLGEIVKALSDDKMLTRRPKIDVFVNPAGCQAVASCGGAFDREGWRVRPAGQPGYFGAGTRRSLHAKFIFSANFRENSTSATSPWTYLGSGNLTGPGFAHAMSPSGGNLEAGVVIGTSKPLYRKQTKGIDEQSIVTNLLPIQWDREAGDLDSPLSVGAAMEERELAFLAAPISFVLWSTDGDSEYLSATDLPMAPFVLLDALANECVRESDGRFRWRGDRPRVVKIRWQHESEVREGEIPVIDEFGRFAATKLPRIDFDEAWLQLDSFPMPPSDEDLPMEGGDPSLGSHTREASVQRSSSYPIRRMMQLIEGIASKQTAIHESDWTSWCTRLEQCLTHACDSPVVEAFRSLAINPLAPLRLASFRPEFAEDSSSPAGSRYEATINRIELAWSVACLRKLGDVA